MRYYAVYYKVDRNDLARYVHPLGDRSVIQIDGRLKLWRVMNIARDTGEARGFDCFALQRAASLRDVSLEDNPLQNLYNCRPTQPI